MKRRPLKYLAGINRSVLPETTEPDYDFAYIDISSVRDGTVEVPPDRTSFKQAPSRARRLAPAGATIVSTVRTYLRATAVVPPAPERLVFSTGFAVLEARQGVDPGYLHYACRSNEFVEEVVARSTGVSYPAIAPSELATIPLPLPAWDEQRLIANFLDDQVARIDRVIELRERQVGLLHDRSIAAMAAVLTGADAASKLSGTPWLPLIPESWNMAPVRAFYDVRLGKMLNPERAAGRFPAPYLRNANVHWFDVDAADLAVMSFEPAERERYRVLPGDLMVCEGGAGIAEAAVWLGADDHIFYSKGLHRVRATGRLPVEWLQFWLRVAKDVGLFEAGGNLSTIPHLTGEQLRAYRIPVPPPGEQPLPGLSRTMTALRGVAELMAEQIRLLHERKQALIDAAVTGEVDVMTARSVA